MTITPTTDYREEHAVLAGLHGRIEVHAEAETHHRSLKQVLRDFLGKYGKR